MIIFLVFLVAAFLVFFDLIQPTYGDLQDKKAAQASSANLLSAQQQSITQAKKMISQYANESQAEGNLALAMPTGPDLSAALAELYGTAQNNNITIQSVGIVAPTVKLTASSTGQATLVKPMGTFPIQVAALGSYENLKNFLSQIETNIRIFDLTALSVQPAPGTAGHASAADFFTYNFTVTTYYQTP